jgi:hypothetical protein
LTLKRLKDAPRRLRDYAGRREVTTSTDEAQVLGVFSTRPTP